MLCMSSSVTNTASVSLLSASEYAVALPVVAAELGMPLHFLHSERYGAWQTASGKTVTYFGIKRGVKLIGCGMAIQYALPGRLSYLYCPYGPVLIDFSPDVVAALGDFFKPWAKQALFVRFDTAVDVFRSPPRAAVATASLQPRNEWVLDITPEPEVLMAQLHSKARYQIRLGERSNVQISFQNTGDDAFQQFYDLLAETSERNDFGLLPKKTYQAVFKSLVETDAYLIQAHIDGALAAAALIYPYAGEGHYVFGCSSGAFRKIGPSYLLQWHSILHARDQGCTRYNFGGISDDVKSTHLQGVTEFKKRFGGETVTHPLPRDLVLQPARYAAFGVYKQLTRK